MAPVAVGVEIADGDRGDALTLEPRDGRLERAPVERRRDLAVEAHPLSHTEAARPWHEGYGGRHSQVVAVVLEPFAHLDDVAVAFGREHAGFRALALKQRVGGDRRAVDNEVGGRQQRAGIGPELRSEEIETVHDTDGRVLRSRGRFGDCDPPVLVHRHEVGEGAADVDSYAIHISGSVASGGAARSAQ